MPACGTGCTASCSTSCPPLGCRLVAGQHRRGVGARHKGGELTGPNPTDRGIPAQACNQGVGGMADASGISEDSLAWTSQWYLREQALRKPNTVLVNRHLFLPTAAAAPGIPLGAAVGDSGRAVFAQPLARLVPKASSSVTGVRLRVRMSSTSCS